MTTEHSQLPLFKLPPSANGTSTRVVRVGPDTDLGWALFPTALRRIHAFCRRFPTDLSGDDQVALARHLWSTAPESLGLWVGIDASYAVFAHLLAVWDARRKVAFVYQLEIDRTVSREQQQIGYNYLESWARALGATAVELVTWHPPRVWTRLGFSVYRTVMRRRID